MSCLYITDQLCVYVVCTTNIRHWCFPNFQRIRWSMGRGTLGLSARHELIHPVQLGEFVRVKPGQTEELFADQAQVRNVVGDPWGRVQ